MIRICIKKNTTVLGDSNVYWMYKNSAEDIVIRNGTTSEFNIMVLEVCSVCVFYSSLTASVEPTT